jgi:hypothetical protein
LYNEIYGILVPEFNITTHYREDVVDYQEDTSNLGIGDYPQTGSYYVHNHKRTTKTPICVFALSYAQLGGVVNVTENGQRIIAKPDLYKSTLLRELLIELYNTGSFYRMVHSHNRAADRYVRCFILTMFAFFHRQSPNPTTPSVRERLSWSFMTTTKPLGRFDIRHDVWKDIESHIDALRTAVLVDFLHEHRSNDTFILDYRTPVECLPIVSWTQSHIANLFTAADHVYRTIFVAPTLGADAPQHLTSNATGYHGLTGVNTEVVYASAKYLATKSIFDQFYSKDACSLEDDKLFTEGVVPIEAFAADFPAHEEDEEENEQDISLSRRDRDRRRDERDALPDRDRD